MSELNEKYFEAVLPFPVSVNDMHYVTRQGGLTLKPAVRKFYTEVRQYIAEMWQYPAMDGRVKVSVWFYECDQRKRDINNYTKTLFDALEGYVYANDKQIDETYLRRCELNEDACVRVVVEFMTELDDRTPIKQVRLAKKKEKAFEKSKENLETHFGKECATLLENYKAAVEAEKKKQSSFKKVKKKLLQENKNG